MRVIGDTQPREFSFSIIPKKPGYILVRFYENAKQYSSNNYSGWEYDEHYLEIKERDNMESYIKNHLNELRAEAVGSASLVERLCANVDYLSMMSGISIPTEEGATNE